MSGYQSDAPPKEYKIVNAITKVTIPGEESFIIEVNHATLVEDKEEYESLIVPFEMMRHGIQVDTTLKKYGGTSGIKVEGKTLPFEFDDEKLFWFIDKPTQLISIH